MTNCTPAPHPFPTRLLATPCSCYCGGEMLAVSGTVVSASVNLTRHMAATHESESDRALVRFSDLLRCADLTDLRIGLTLVTISSYCCHDNKHYKVAIQEVLVVFSNLLEERQTKIFLASIWLTIRAICQKRKRWLDWTVEMRRDWLVLRWTTALETNWYQSAR